MGQGREVLRSDARIHAQTGTTSCVRLGGVRALDDPGASGTKPPGCTPRPDTWLHPNASHNRQIPLLHRGRRPYMALLGPAGPNQTLRELPSQPAKSPPIRGGLKLLFSHHLEESSWTRTNPLI